MKTDHKSWYRMTLKDHERVVAQCEKLGMTSPRRGPVLSQYITRALTTQLGIDEGDLTVTHKDREAPQHPFAADRKDLPRRPVVDVPQIPPRPAKPPPQGPAHEGPTFRM